MFEEPKTYWNDKECNGPWSAVILVQVHSDTMTSTMKRGAFLMYPGHAVLLDFNLQLRRNFIYNEHGLMGFLSVGNGEDNNTVQPIDDQECCGNKPISVRSEIVFAENFIAQRTVLKGRDENMKIVHTQIRSISNCLHQCYNDVFEVTPSDSSCSARAICSIVLLTFTRE